MLGVWLLGSNAKDGMLLGVWGNMVCSWWALCDSLCVCACRGLCGVVLCENWRVDASIIDHVRAVCACVVVVFFLFCLCFLLFVCKGAWWMPW